MIPPLPATTPTRPLRSAPPIARLAARGLADMRASRRLGAMVEASGVVTLLCDADGLSVHVLDAAGDANPASVGTSLWSWMHPDDRADAQLRWLVGVEHGVPFDMEWRMAGPHDPPRSAKFRVAPVPEDTGTAREWLVTLADVTEVRHATAELQRQRELSRSVIAASRDGILAFGPDHIALEWNASFERLAHAPHARVAAVPWTSLFPFAAPSALLARASLMLEDGQPFLHQETFGDVALDMARMLEFDFSPVHDSAGEISGGMCQVRDVTERLLLDGHQIQSAKMDSMGLLAAGIAHDFNNSLAGIMGLAELIEMDLPPDSPALDSARELVTSATRARDLVRQILAFARHEPVRLVPIDLRAILGESVRLMRKLLPKNIEVQVDVPESVVAVHADAAQLQQVIVNLCTNAEHAMRGALSGALHVSLDVQLLDGEAAHQLPGVQPGAHAVLTVTDTGAGMSAETLARIFEPFFTTKAPGEGTGMGLAMVQQIAASHRGGFAAESTPGVGTSMHLYLPLATGETVPSADIGPVMSNPVGRGSVLVLDDEPLLAQLLADALAHFGFRTRAFLRADDALEAFEANPESFDAVITDHGMPGMTGDLVAERILARRPGVPIVLLTGYAPPITPERARTIGITDVVTKPVSFRSLAQTLVTRLALRDASAVATNATAAVRQSA